MNNKEFKELIKTIIEDHNAKVLGKLDNKETVHSLKGKEFKDEISKITDNTKQYFLVINEDRIGKAIRLLEDNECHFQFYEDYNGLFADKESSEVLHKICDQIPDDIDFKIDPVTFVDTICHSVYNDVILDEDLSNKILNKVQDTMNLLIKTEGEDM